MNKLPSELKLIVSRKFRKSDAWDFAELLKLIEEEVQAQERTSARAAYGSRQPKELPTGAALHHHHIAASLNNSTHCRIVKQSQELSLVVSHYKGLVDALFVWERVRIVLAESNVLAAREDIMLQFAQAS